MGVVNETTEGTVGRSESRKWVAWRAGTRVKRESQGSRPGIGKWVIARFPQRLGPASWVRLTEPTRPRLLPLACVNGSWYDGVLSSE